MGRGARCAYVVLRGLYEKAAPQHYMKRLLLSTTAMIAAAALATEASAVDDIELDLSGYFNGVGGARVEADASRIRDYTFGLDSELHLESSYLFRNGLEIGLPAGGKINRDTDDPKRGHLDGILAGTIVASAGIDSACGGIAGYGLYGYFGGYIAGLVNYASLGGYVRNFCGSNNIDNDFLQETFAFFEGPFGRLEFGRQYGVGHQMSFLAPTIFRGSNVNDWEIDLSGVNTVNTRNTVNNGFDDFSPKVVYLTPRIFGLQGGVSFAPETDDCGYDFCPRTDSAFFPSQDEVIELGANFYHTFSNGTLEGVSVGVSGTYLMADSKTTAAIATMLGIDDYEAWNVGASVAIDGFTIGGSFKNAELAVLGSNYLAYDVGATYERGAWGFMVSYGADDNQLTGQETMAIQGGVDFMLGSGVSVGIGAQYVDANFETSTLLSAAGLSLSFSDIDSTAVFIETDISF